MISLTYLEVAVDAPLGRDRTLTYSLPPGVRLSPGWLVWVPLLSRAVQGVVVARTDTPPTPELAVREALSGVGPGPMVTPWRLELARWLGHHYRSSLFEAVSLMLPPGYKDRVRSRLHPPEGGTTGLARLAPELASALSKAGVRGLSEREAEQLLGRQGPRLAASMVRHGELRRSWEIPRPRIAHRYDCYLRLMPDSQLAASQLSPRAPRQQALLDAVVTAQSPLEVSLARKEFGSAAVEALIARGVMGLDWVRAQRKPDLGPAPLSQRPMVLTAAQEEALSPVLAALSDSSASPRTFLLHGVTGSGKTEVYLRALEACRAQGQQGILLVPEIALTPQMVHRLGARFGSRVALMHSSLAQGALFDQWWRIKEGDFDVVLGPRSAAFAPVPNLGLVILDEEHEWNYKEQERSPRYHAREVALEMARHTGAVVLMGSATPDVTTYHGALREAYQLLRLPHRITPSRAIAGPAHGNTSKIEICDMRCELKEGNSSIFSRSLQVSLRECLALGEQAILFINRRGASSFVQCRDCGQVVQCRSCTVALSYHSSVGRLVCHVCGRSLRVPARCRGCRSTRIRYLGLGVQRVADEAACLAPGVSIARWDSDAAPTGEAHQRILANFESGKTRLLVGTQMVAKGLDVPAVTLVGAVLADVGLTLPDYRAGERVFQLLCQVVGRAGRGDAPGKAIIQTYSPDHYAIMAAAGQDYPGFYQKELGYRRDHGNPPFSRLIHLSYHHTDPQACQRGAIRLGRILRQRMAGLGLTGVQVVGPAPSYPERVRGRYRWHILLRGGDLDLLLEETTLPAGWVVDVDPVSVL